MKSRVEKGGILGWTPFTTTGVGDGNGNYVPVCNFDCDNTACSGKAVFVSITIDIWENIEKDLGYDASMPEVFYAINQNKQQVNSSILFRACPNLAKNEAHRQSWTGR